jgi:VIT1/CCC1 family predicted Fe2+/Mn2+ transporter
MMPTRDLNAARDAYRSLDAQASRKAHEASVAEPHRQAQGRYLKSVVYGGLDGIVTTFAVVAGVTGASLSSGIVLILGFANLIADGLSMAIGDYLSTKAENEYHRAERAREVWEVENYPEGEKRELVELYEARGLSHDDAKTVVDIISRNRQTWVDVMMVEELGIVESGESPAANAIATFLSFAVFGFVTLVAYVVGHCMSLPSPHLFVIACLLTAATLFALGAVKVRITGRTWWKAGFEMLVVGGLAAAAAYAVGRALSGLG